MEYLKIFQTKIRESAFMSESRFIAFVRLALISLICFTIFFWIVHESSSSAAYRKLDLLPASLPRKSIDDSESGSNHIHVDALVEFVREYRIFPHNSSIPTDYSPSSFWGKSYSNRPAAMKKVMSNYILERLNYKTNGFFVECGAVDGAFLSNSILLEQKFNWTGLLVEADPAHTPTLKKRNRKAWVADVCLSTKNKSMEVEMKGNNRAASGHGYIVNEVIQEARKNFPQKNYRRKFKVLCIPLKILLNALNRTEVDYFSLDVEGMEFEVLKTIPFDKIRIKLISVEVWPRNKQEIKLFLESNGYKRIREVVVRGEYMHDDVYELEESPTRKSDC